MASKWVILSKAELLELYDVTTSALHEDDLQRAARALLRLSPAAHKRPATPERLYEVLLQGFLVKLSPRHIPDTKQLDYVLAAGPGYVLRPLRRVLALDSAASSSGLDGRVTGLLVEVCYMKGILESNFSAAGVDAAVPGPVRWDGDGVPPGAGPGTPLQATCTCCACEYLNRRGVFRLPWEQLWSDGEEASDAKAQDEGSCCDEVYIDAMEELFGEHILFPHPTAVPLVTRAVLQLLRNLACRLRLHRAAGDRLTAKEQLEAQLRKVTSELSGTRQQVRDANEALEAELELAPPGGQSDQLFQPLGGPAAPVRVNPTEALKQWRLQQQQQQRCHKMRQQVELLERQAQELEKQRLAAVAELKHLLKDEEAAAAEQKAVSLKNDTEILLRQLCMAVEEEEAVRRQRPNAAQANAGAAAAALVAVEGRAQQAFGQQEARGIYEPPSKRPCLEQHQGLQQHPVDVGRAARDDSVVWSMLQNDYLLARVMTLRVATLHDAISDNGDEVNMGRLPPDARRRFDACNLRAVRLGARLLANGEPVPTDVHVMERFVAMQQQQKQPLPQQLDQPQQLQHAQVQQRQGSHTLQPHSRFQAPSSAPADAPSQPAVPQAPQQPGEGLAGLPTASGLASVPAAAAHAAPAAVLVHTHPGAADVPALAVAPPFAGFVPAARPPRPSTALRIKTPAHLQPLQNSKLSAPLPAYKGSRSRSPSPLPALCQVRPVPTVTSTADTQPQALGIRLAQAGGNAAPGSNGWGPAYAGDIGAPVAVAMQLPSQQPCMTPYHAHCLPAPLQHSHQQQGVQAQQLPLQQVQPWQTGVIPVGFSNQKMQSPWAPQDPIAPAHTPPGPAPMQAVSATSLFPPPACGAPFLQPHHTQPDAAGASLWEGALELVWTDQASATGSRPWGGAEASHPRILQGARLLATPLPTFRTPQPQQERAFSGLAALLQQAGVTAVLPVVPRTAAKEKEASELEQHIGSYRYLAPELGLLTFAGQDELKTALAFTVAHGLCMGPHEVPQEPPRQPEAGTGSGGGCRVRYVDSSVTLKQGPATGHVLSVYLFGRASGAWASEVLAAGLPETHRALLTAGQALLLLAQLRPGSTAATNGVTASSGGSGSSLPSAPSQTSTRARSPLARAEVRMSTHSAKRLPNPLSDAAAAHHCSSGDCSVSPVTVAGQAAANSAVSAIGAGAPAVTLNFEPPSQPRQVQSLEPPLQRSKSTAGRLQPVFELDGRDGGCLRARLPADSKAAAGAQTSDQAGVGVACNHVSVTVASDAAASQPGARLDEALPDEHGWWGSRSPGPLWPPVGLDGRTRSPIYTFSSDTDGWGA
ncbi:hypothetical protein HYH02_005095 [Chlamydomonas schloesseri]|uniref:Uncharacterized protein n=1 Tax=Chlamydomonas schloesseri TaxID=2026947 RepID=A0A835WL32_9CHLO|nr:hypothetical protein HYH02_005095 [Chlamydomonas schloesseri]|eukprot:KAG2449562.1 hypothetical protein HYH02_005095 [Chlamydomonas schloesseri]